jgi:NAD(P)H-hydrate epimerase
MYQILSAATIRKIDEEALANSNLKYMQEAVMALVNLLEFLELSSEHKILIVSGQGNNGGDGILLQAELMKLGHEHTRLCLLTEADKLTGSAKLAYNKLTDWFQEPKQAELKFEDYVQGMDKLQSLLLTYKPDYIVDAMLGIGFAGESLRDPYLSAVNLIEDYQELKPEAKILAVDIPTGVHADSGLASRYIKADYTLSIGFNKLCAFQPHSKKAMGEIYTCDLSYPPNITAKYAERFYVVDPLDIKNLIPARSILGNKYTHGVAAIVAGTQDMPGAAIMACEASLKTGLGMLYSFSSPETKWHLDNLCFEGIHQAEHYNNFVVKMINKKVGAVGCGPAIGLNEAAKDYIVRLLIETRTNLVLDADALVHLKKHLNMLAEYPGRIMLTPHAGEFKKLFGEDLETYHLMNKVNKVLETAQQYQVNILYKGPMTIITDYEQAKVYLCPVYDSTLARAGSGDILTGLITGLAAQGLSLIDASLLAVNLQAQAANFAQTEFSQHAMSARDILAHLPAAYREFINFSDNL